MTATALTPGPHATRVVALGGGTGLPIVLRGLKDALFPAAWRLVPRRGRDRLTAIVTVADDGGSSGRLRDAYGTLPPGDIRNCLVALSDGDPVLSAIFDYRFDEGGDVGGHSLGNLILTALARLDGDFPRAVERAGALLAARGRVLPSTAAQVRLRAELEDGSWCYGESRIPRAAIPVRAVELVPPDVEALPEAVEAIRAADVVVIGPGSLYTSVMPVLLVPGIARALAETPARVALVMNLMTEPGETDGYDAASHLRAVRRHAPAVPISDVILNALSPDAERSWTYARAGAAPIVADVDALARLGCRVWARELLSDDDKVRHDPRKLAAVVLEIAEDVRAGATGSAEAAAS